MLVIKIALALSVLLSVIGTSYAASKQAAKEKEESKWYKIKIPFE